MKSKAKADIRTFRDILKDNILIDWTVTKYKINLQDSHKKTYSMVKKALEASGVRSSCCSDACLF